MDMQLNPSAAHKSDPAKFAASRNAAAGPREDRLKKACADFEAIFINMIFKSMRSTLSGEDIYGKSLGRDIYESMYFKEVATDLARNGRGLGLADILYKDLKALEPGAQASGSGNGHRLQSIRV